MGRNVFLAGLILEVTRKCNMSCSHCLRGEPQNKNMSPKVIDALFNDRRLFFGALNFSGGEPMLNRGLIVDILNRLRYDDKGFSSIWMKTNGLIFPRKLLSVWSDLQRDMHLDSEISGISVSTDQYHDNIWDNYWKWAEWEYFIEGSRHLRLLDTSVLKEGRATTFGNQTPKPTTISFNLEPEINELYVDNYDIYINAYGDVIPGCDFSYESQEALSIGNVLQTPLSQIMENIYAAERQIKMARHRSSLGQIPYRRSYSGLNEPHRRDFPGCTLRIRHISQFQQK